MANWEKDEELGIMEPVKEPLPNPETKQEVGTEPLHVSAWRFRLWWLGEFVLKLNFEFNSSIRVVNSSIRSLSDEICSES